MDKIITAFVLLSMLGFGFYAVAHNKISAISTVEVNEQHEAMIRALEDNKEALEAINVEGLQGLIEEEEAKQQ